MVFIENRNKDAPKLWKTHKLSTLDINFTPTLFAMNPKPFQDELLSSWLCRLAKANFFSYVQFLRNFTEIDFKIMKNSNIKQYWMFDLDKEIPNELLSALSRRTGLSKENILKLTLKEWEDNIYYRFITRKGSISSKKLGALRFCPLCLKEDKIPYFRKFWRTRLATCCEKHNIYLYDRCSNPDCKRPINISLIKYEKSIKECVYCGIDLSNSDVIKIPENSHDIGITKNLKSLLREGRISISDEHLSSFLFFEAMYFLCRFIIKYFPFKESEFSNHFVITSGLLVRERDFLSQRNFVFENMQISQLVLEIAYSFLEGYPIKIKEFISKYQPEFNYETQKECPKLLKKFRNSKGNNPEITNKRILEAIDQLIKKGIHISYKNIAKEARCAQNFYLSHPHLKKLVESIKKESPDIFTSHRKKKPSNEINIKPNEVINAINKLKRENKKITYKAIGILIKENYWNLKERPEIVSIIKPHLTSKAPTKKYFFNEEDILNIIELIRNERLKVSINEVCRKLNCSKSFFRNKPHLKKIILKAMEEDKEKLLSELPNNGNYEVLSKEAKIYEPIFIKYKNELEQQGKNWKVAKTKITSEKLMIPHDILIEIKLKYCPSTRKTVRNQIQQNILKRNTGTDLSKKAKAFEIEFVNYVEEMDQKGKLWKYTNNKTLSTKLNIPIDILKEMRKIYLGLIKKNQILKDLVSQM